MDTIVRRGVEASERETVREMMGPMIKILILIDISILEFYEYIGYIGDVLLIYRYVLSIL